MPKTYTNTKQSHKNILTAAVSMALASSGAQAVTFNVTAANDDGTGLVANTLSWAILQANTTAGDDVIELNTDVTITGVMKRLIDSNTTLQSDSIRRTIDGNNQFRPLFIKSGQVTIQDLDIENGRAEGGGSFRGGNGAGFGGGIFIFDGTVLINQSNITGSTAIGATNSGGFGGGGMFGNSSVGGGGLFANSSGDTGGYGGYGNYQLTEVDFGQGGQYSDLGNGDGGFGGGGGYGYYEDGGDGGFGSGGAYGYYESGGNGGFGGGRGGDGGFSGVAGTPGYGSNGSDAAGFGGGLFLRSGMLSIKNTVFQNNLALKTGFGSTESEGFGGAMFVMHTIQNSNGNNQGMPQTLPTVSGCGVVFNNNQADTDPDTSNNNNDVFDLANLIVPDSGSSLSDPCGPPTIEIQINGNGIEIIDGDVTPEPGDGTDMGERVVGFESSFQTFTIENVGNQPIQLTGNPVINLLNNDNNQFEVEQQPVNTIIEGGQSLDFQILFDSQLIGLDTVTVEIENNDSDENPYDFLIQATGLDAVNDIIITGNSVEIVDGDMTPESADDTDFGTGTIGGSSITKTFSIDNIGFAGLNLTGNPIVDLQNNSGQFTVSAQPQSAFVEPGVPVTFDVTYTPANEGMDTATITIANDDTDENPYDFVIQANAVIVPSEISVLGNEIEIADGDMTPEAGDFTAMGQAQENAQTITRTYTILNEGLGELMLSGMPLVELQNNSGQFSVTTQPAVTTLNSKEEVSFDVTFTPTSIGLDTATVVIQNNDPDEAPYDFVIEAEGTALAPILQVSGNGIVIENMDNSAMEADNTFFGYTPVNGGFFIKPFELKNIGFAPLNLDTVFLDSFYGDFFLINNLDNTTLNPGESVDADVLYDPFNPGINEFTFFNVVDDSFNVIHSHSIEAYGQPTASINAANNYLQEGDVAELIVTTDTGSQDFLEFNWQVTGQVDGQDFGGVLPSGTGFVDAFNDVFTIQIPTTQDGIYEGPELFNVQLSMSDPRLNIGFPSVAGGVIDDDLIFVAGFDALNLNQLINGIAKFAPQSEALPVCDNLGCDFLNRSISFSLESQNQAADVLVWLTETLVLVQPLDDWDGDGLPNKLDLNPFGFNSKLLHTDK